jgi:NADH-quinone oxidoreductase subunit H
MNDFWTGPVGWSLIHTGQIVLILVVVLVSVAFLILADRKIWAGVQLRKGPNVVGPFGLFQSFADMFKFVFKEQVIPAAADKFVFMLAPMLSVVFGLIGWAVIPVGPGWTIANIDVGILYLFATSSLGVYGIMMAGWSSNSKYPFLGALRSAAQMVSYEVSLGFILITVVALSGTMNLNGIVARQEGWFWNWNVFGGGGLKQLPLAIVMIPMAVMFFISFLAETNRPPFDLPEAESELVAGYQVEYSSTLYLLIMLAEYSNIVLMCALISTLFFGGWSSPYPTGDLFTHGGSFLWIPMSVWGGLHGVLWLAIKVVFWFFMVALVKAIVPRYRYDQLMRLGWKVFLPTSLVAVVAIFAWRVYGVS